jgi:hypothetical protein
MSDIGCQMSGAGWANAEFGTGISTADANGWTRISEGRPQKRGRRRKGDEDSKRAERISTADER